MSSSQVSVREKWFKIIKPTGSLFIDGKLYLKIAGVYVPRDLYLEVKR